MFPWKQTAPRGSYGGHLGFYLKWGTKPKDFHNFWTGQGRKTYKPILPYNYHMRKCLKAYFADQRGPMVAILNFIYNERDRKTKNFHNFWTRHHRKTNKPSFPYNFHMRKRLKALFCRSKHALWVKALNQMRLCLANSHLMKPARVIGFRKWPTVCADVICCTLLWTACVLLTWVFGEASSGHWL